ncbi:uncharacterized protein TNCV_3719371 [Trichonephila clavipes]|nr:uncharacterized protein TNCV_3719371 [Trichonephila clavipes]
MFGSRSLQLDERWQASRRSFDAWILTSRKVFSEESEWKSESSYWLLKSEDNGSGKMAVHGGVTKQLLQRPTSGMLSQLCKISSSDLQRKRRVLKKNIHPIAVDCIQQEKKMMSETHSEKQKFGKAVESSANKKARREVSKKYGKFTEDCIPDGVFPTGDDVFVFASTYYDSVSVHIRRFKKYGKTYYPTPEGITLDPRWIEYIMRKKKVPESLEELPSGLFPPERHIQITSENFIYFTFKRIKYGPHKEPTFKEITISREQWAEMIEKYGAIENAAIDNMFQCMDFLTAYKTFCEGPIQNALPSSLDVCLGPHYLTQILKKSICSLLNEKGLKQPQTFAEELWGNREETFNSYASSLEANEIADCFYNNLLKMNIFYC